MLTRGVCAALVGVGFLVGQWAIAGVPAEKTPKKDAGQAAEKAKPAVAFPYFDVSKKGTAAKAESKASASSPPSVSSAPKKESVKKGDRTMPGVPESCETPAKTPKPRDAGRSLASHSCTSSAEAIRRALAKPIELEFVETPISDVVEFLKGNLHIPIVLDGKALSDVGVAPDTPMTSNLRGISAKSALNLILDDLGLTWVISNEVLLITTPEKVESLLENTVYEVHDLVAARDEKGTPVNDFDQLIEVITSTIVPTTWDTVGGPGSIAPFEGNGITALSISQTQHVQEQIAKLLADLRKASHAKPGEPLYIRTIRSEPKGGAGGSIMGNPPSPNKPAGNQPTPDKVTPQPTGGGMGGGGGGGGGAMF